MNAAVVVVAVLAAYLLAYRFYSRFLSQRVFGLARDEPVPSREQEDGIDYVPTKLHVLWGHHYTSIAGAAPIVGPALAVIWGWLPALVWVVLGTIFMGAVHDFGALVISLRNRGRSIADIAAGVISARARTLFLLIICVLIWIVLAVFAYIIATLFVQFPSAIFPINVQILVALALGWLVYRLRVPILLPSLVGFGILLGAVFLGERAVQALPSLAGISVLTWTVLLLVYSFVSSVLPVRVLLQPRDYLNSHQLILALLLLGAGIFVLRPEIVAPALNLSPEGSPPLLPFLFITIACGAISGFHGLVSSGTTSKQIGRMPDARPIGYGGMLGEGTLGLLAVMATTAGFVSAQEWWAHYGSWGAASGLGTKLGAFVNGGARFSGALGLPLETGKTLIAVMVIAFAATSLDTGARIQRLIIAELAEAWNLKPLANRYVASATGILAALLLATTQAGGKGGLMLWPLFGTTNQLVAGITLLVISLWLRRSGRPYLYTFVPMLFISVVTFVAMLGEVGTHLGAGNWLLAASGSAILVLYVWILGEGVAAFSKRPPGPVRAPVA
ncbi:MAG: carbon starvation protein A [Myxococcales bacterium]|nr:carbon starvation protein A [Myxococcales bacterium]